MRINGKRDTELFLCYHFYMRRILIFSLVYYPRFIGGAEVAIKEITDRISPEEIEFDMVTLRLDSRLPKFEKIGNINIHRLGLSSRQKNSSDSLSWYLHFNKYLFVFLGFFKALSLHKKNKYNAIWSMMATYNSFAAVLFKLCSPQVPFILTLQEGDPIPYIKRRALPAYPLFKMIFTRADYIQTISNYLADWAKEMKATCPVVVIPNAVDFEVFSHKKPQAGLEILKQKLGKKTDDIFLITTSRLVVKNAVGDIIDSLQYLPHNVKFLVLGTGYQEEELKEKVEKLKLSERVKFLGYVSHKEMPQYLHISDIFIRPSLSEGFGNSYIEAMAAGIPIIATPVGGIVDFLRDGETGLFCDVSSPKSIAQKVEKLIKDTESRDFIIKNAIKMVKEKYQWSLIASDMKNKVFLMILDKKL